LSAAVASFLNYTGASMDPITSLSLFKSIAEACKKIADIARDVKDYETKQKLGEVQDVLISLKQQASELEDENRELREKLRFKSEEFEFKNPFWYEKAHPERALCPKCFSKNIVAPVAAPYRTSVGTWRWCLACGTQVQETRDSKSSQSFQSW
jgi:hypothetical protein